MNRKLKLEDYKNCLEPTQLKNKLNYLEKNIYILKTKKDLEEKSIIFPLKKLVMNQ